MFQRAPQPKRKAGVGPRYYRVPSVWGLLFTFVVVLLLIALLFRLG